MHVHRHTYRQTSIGGFLLAVLELAIIAAFGYAIAAFISGSAIVAGGKLALIQELARLLRHVGSATSLVDRAARRRGRGAHRDKPQRP